MRVKYSVVCLAISILLGAVFWILDSIINYYLFHENLRFLLLDGPESVLDSVFFRISPRELISRTFFMVFSILAGLLMAVFIIREKEKDAFLKKIEAWHLDLANLAQETSDLADYFAALFKSMAGILYADSFFVSTRDMNDGCLTHYAYGRKGGHPAGDGVAEKLVTWLLGRNTPQLLSGKELDRAVAKDLNIRASSGGWSCIGVPLTRNDQSIGVMMIQSFDPDQPYRPDDLAHFLTIAPQVATAIERKLDHERLKSAEEKFSKAFLSSPAWMIISSMETGEILEVNKAFLNATGYTKSDLVGYRDDAVGLWKSREDKRRLARWITRYGGARNLEIEILDRQASPISALCSGEILNISGRRCLLCAALDLREIKQLENRLKQAQKMESIGNLAGGIAHDFNNILFPIVGMAELLLADLPQGSELHENTQEILKAGKRGSDLVKQIMAFSRQSEHKKIPVHVQQVIREVMRLMRATLPAYIELAQYLDPDCGMILADPSQIHQVALNIMTNAYHAVEPGTGTIRVDLKEQTLDPGDLPESSLDPGPYVVLSISDTGQGMSANIISKIFEPYFTTKEKGKGTGLGLAVAYGIIKEHNGDIRVDSEVGQGTTFNIFFPLMQGDRAAAPDARPMPLQTGNEAILLVDDEEAVIQMEQKMLVRLGYRVTPRLSSVDALAAFRARPDAFDLVMSDMSMPGLTGDEFTREVKTVRPDIPVIICTGFSDRINKEKAQALGVNGFLMKPIVIAELAGAVRKVLDNPCQDNDRTV